MAEKNLLQIENEYLQLVEQLLRNLRFGSVTITVQDGKVVQIDKNEKIRVKN